MTSMAAKSAPLFVFTVALTLFPYSVIAASDFYDLVDIVHVQDVSSSFQPFWPELTTKIAGVVTLIRDSRPNTYFGVASFGDKNISGINPKTKEVVTLGSATDYCLRVDQPLARIDASRMEILFDQFQSRSVEGGDSHAGVYEALYRAVTASNLRWRQEPLGGTNRIGRYIILATGSVSHLPGDVLKLTGKTVRPFDITPHKIRGNQNNENYDCDKVDYPKVEQVAKLIKRLKDTFIVILVPPSGKVDSNGQFHPYPSIAGLDSEFQTVDGLKRWYERQFADLNLVQVRFRQLVPGKLTYGHLMVDILDGLYTRDRHIGLNETDGCTGLLTETGFVKKSAMKP